MAPRLITERVLVIEKQSRLTEMDNRYAIRDPDGALIGTARTVGGGAIQKVARLLTDGRLAQTLQVADERDAVVLALKRSAKLGLARVTVVDGQGAVVGAMVQETLRRLAIEKGGGALAVIDAADGEPSVYAVHDTGGRELARISKSRQGTARRLFTKAERYVLEVHGPLDEPLRTLVAASPLALDIALPRDAEGQELVTGLGG